MDNIEISKVCGLCTGCRHALDLTYKALQSGNKVCLFKELVHNESIMDNLSKKGAVIKNSLEEINSDELVIIRAHGEPPETYEYFKNNNINYVDCTCVKVQKIHEFVKTHSDAGDVILIIGKYGKNSKKIHPEVQGTVGYAAFPILIEDESDISKLESIYNKRMYLVCQTTYNEFKAKQIIDKIKTVAKRNNCELEINFSICGVQSQINYVSSELALSRDLMFVVGSKSSSNTTELYNNLCHITNTIFLEKNANFVQELQKYDIKIDKTTKIGITAGASTDPNEIKNLKRKIEKYLLENDMNFNVNAHSSIQIENIFIDPYLIDDDTKKAEYILLTHTHYDHMSLPDIQKVATEKTIFVAPKDASETLEKSFPKNKKIYAVPNQVINLKNLVIETLPAYNTDKQFHKKEYNWLAYKITLDNVSYLICGDSDKTDELLEQSADVLFVPIGGTYTMNATEAAELCNEINPNIVVPVHYNSIVGNKDDEKEFIKNLNKNIEVKTFY